MEVFIEQIHVLERPRAEVYRLAFQACFDGDRFGEGGGYQGGY
jgi:hypothetical protein